MKEFFCSLCGIIGAAVAALFGGWTSAMTTLVVFMAVDYVSGMVVAGVFQKSPKTETGGLSSNAGWKGLLRKCMTLLMVLIACRLDLLIGTNYIRDAVVIALCANELLSVVENAGLMGVPIPAAITKAIDVLNNRNENVGGSE